MAKHQYKITVEALETQQTLTFETENHDDLFKIFERVEKSATFDRNDSLSLALGLKLFSEMLLTHKSFPPFEVLRPYFPEFMKSFKAEMAKENN
jgi:Domain of Unknown Function with PDB structure (DUF3861)